METAGFFEIFFMFIRLHYALMPHSNFYCHVYNCRSDVVIWSQKHFISPFNSSSKIYVNIILSHTSLHSPLYHASGLSHALDLIILIIIAMNASMKLLVTHFSPPSSYFILLKSNYFLTVLPQHPLV
jgi:hypothetical protein